LDWEDRSLLTGSPIRRAERRHLHPRGAVRRNAAPWEGADRSSLAPPSTRPIATRWRRSRRSRYPSPTTLPHSIGLPIYKLLLVSLGVDIFDLDLERVSETAKRLGRYKFLFTDRSKSTKAPSRSTRSPCSDSPVNRNLSTQGLIKAARDGLILGPSHLTASIDCLPCRATHTVND